MRIVRVWVTETHRPTEVYIKGFSSDKKAFDYVTDLVTAWLSYLPSCLVTKNPASVFGLYTIRDNDHIIKVQVL